MCNIDLLIFILIFIVAVLIAYKYYCYVIKTDSPVCILEVLSYFFFGGGGKT